MSETSLFSLAENAEKVAYLINTTPKYFYLLPLHVGLVKRYEGDAFFSDIFLATEEPDHPICQELQEKQGVQILRLSAEDSGFLKSRAAALAALPPDIRYVLPVQEDFLLERTPDFRAIRESLDILRNDPTVQSLRWMPCPGPAAGDTSYGLFSNYKVLSAEYDEYLFTFQATLWRREAIQTWYERLCAQFELDHPGPLPRDQRITLEIRANYAENQRGQKYFEDWMMGPEKLHLAWRRAHRFPNAVYMCPWPYRPTAVVGGRLEPWAVDLGKREGWPLMNQ